MKKKPQSKFTLGIILVLGVVLVVLFSLGKTALGNVTQDSPSGLPQGFRNYTFFATSTNQVYFATTTTAFSTSITPWVDSSGRVDNGYFVVAGAKRVTFYFKRGDTTGQGNSGSTLFDVDVSPDGTNWYDYNKLEQNLATSTAKTYLSSVTISAASSTVITSLDIARDSIYAVRCHITETTDGEHSCSASADW